MHISECVLVFMRHDWISKQPSCPPPLIDLEGSSFLTYEKLICAAFESHLLPEPEMSDRSVRYSLIGPAQVHQLIHFSWAPWRTPHPLSLLQHGSNLTSFHPLRQRKTRMSFENGLANTAKP
jgi:hypothetical protein